MTILRKFLLGAMILSGIALAISAITYVIDPSSNSWSARSNLAGAVFAISTFAWAFQSAPMLTEHDQKLFAEFRALFADRGLIRTYREHDFLSPFRRDYYTPLQTVAEAWDDAAHSFTDKRLEALRAEFVVKATDLAVTIAGNTVPAGQFMTVFPRGMDPENPSDVVRDEVKQINAKVKPFVNAHEALVREGNKRGAKPSSKPAATGPAYSREPDIPATKSAVFAYLQGNARLIDLTHALVQRRKLKLEPLREGLAWLDERIELAGIKTIRELDDYVARYGALADSLSNYYSPVGPITIGFLLEDVLNIVVIERDGVLGLRKMYEQVQLGSGHDADEIYKNYLEVKAAHAAMSKG